MSNKDQGILFIVFIGNRIETGRETKFDNFQIQLWKMTMTKFDNFQIQLWKMKSRLKSR